MAVFTKKTTEVRGTIREIEAEIKRLHGLLKQQQAYLQGIGTMEQAAQSALQQVQNTILAIQNLDPDELETFQEAVNELFRGTPIAALTAEDPELSDAEIDPELSDAEIDPELSDAEVDPESIDAEVDPELSDAEVDPELSDADAIDVDASTGEPESETDTESETTEETDEGELELGISTDTDTDAVTAESEQSDRTENGSKLWEVLDSSLADANSNGSNGNGDQSDRTDGDDGEVDSSEFLDVSDGAATREPRSVGAAAAQKLPAMTREELSKMKRAQLWELIDEFPEQLGHINKQQRKAMLVGQILAVMEEE